MPLPFLQMPKIEDDVLLLQGGLDVTTPNLRLKPGHVRSAENWQCIYNKEGGGYERIGGYERFNGGTAPSSATVTTLAFDNWVHTPDQWNYTTIPPTWPDAVNWPVSWEGAFVLGGTSGAIAKLIAYVDETVPDHYLSTNYIAVTVQSGQFVSGETIYIAGADIAGNIGGGVAIVGVWGGESAPSITAKSQAQFLALAADAVRTYGGTSAVGGTSSGSGSILGVFSLVVNGVRTVYAFRNSETGTTSRLFKAVSTGTYFSSLLSTGEWQSIGLGYEIGFTAGGATVPAEGATLTQGAVTATIKRVVLESGDWDANTAAGRFIIDAPSGGTFGGGAATIGAITVTLSGAESAITLLPNGKYQLEVANFGGQLTQQRAYGTDGVNRAFEFDGTVFVPIETKAPQDTPKFVRAHHNHLCLALGSSLMISGPGTPYCFDAAAGALELATGDEIVGLLPQPGDQTTAALAVFGRNRTGLLYGTSANDFSYKLLSSGTGSIPYMQANLDQGYALDDRGVISLSASQEYGNFKHATLTPNLGEFLNQRKSLAVMACVSTDRSQLRLFFSDATAMYLTIVNGRPVESMPQQFSHTFTCVWNAEDASGNEETFAGDTNGIVYQLDRGSSFNGQPITHHFRLTPNFMRAPRIKKQFRNGSLEVQSDYYAEFSLGYALSYSSTLIFQPDAKLYGSTFSATPSWDAFVWDDFIWDGVTLSPTEVEIKGKAEAIEMIVSGSSDYVYPFRLSSLITHYNYTRRTR